MKHRTILCLLISVLAPSMLFSEPRRHAEAGSVLGQSDFVTDTVADPPTSSSLSRPEGIAIDPVSGKVFVADSGNNRILRFSSEDAYTTGAAAEAVFGQADFVSNDANRGGAVAANTLDYPLQLAIGPDGRLWVTDYGNHRVLRFDDAANKPGSSAADGVLGQADFMSEIDLGTTGTHSRFSEPAGITVDSSGNLWVADALLNRILRFDNAASKNFLDPASAVIGQADLGSFSPGLSATRLSAPYGISVDSKGRLWVADEENDRVLRFDAAASDGNGPAADGILGQDDFDSNGQPVATTADTFYSPYYVSAQDNGTVWVSDYNQVRVLGFRSAAKKRNGAPANTVLGQPDFTTGDHRDPTSRTLVGPAQVAFGKLGSLFVVVYDDSRVMRFTALARISPQKKRLKTRRSRVTFRGTSSGTERIQYRVSGQGGYQNAKGSAERWKGKTGRLKRKVTRVTVRGYDLDGDPGIAKMKIIRDRR